MGGLGSGRPWGHSSRQRPEDYRSLDIRYLKRQGGLVPGRNSIVTWLDRNDNKTGKVLIRAEVDNITLKYRYRDHNFQWHEIENQIELTCTSCNLGGRRIWFLCPNPTCRKRIAILFSGKLFVCRHCLELVYESQYEDEDLRALRKANEIRGKLGWSHGVLDGQGPKPQRMHWKTYKRFVSKYDLLMGSLNEEI